MQIKTVDHPWQHYIVDDFLDKHDFSLVFDHCNQYINLKTEREQHWYDKDSEIYNLFNFYAYNFLTKINQLHRVKKYNFQCERSICAPGYDYDQIHVDAISKVFSIVLYVSDHGRGTEIYASLDRSSFLKIIEWKQNRAIAFFRSDKSWHNFANINIPFPRVTINSFFSKCYTQ